MPNRENEHVLDIVPPECRPTVNRLQLVLDGELSSGDLQADPHPGVCPACRERIAAARLMLDVLARGPAIAASGVLTQSILQAVRGDQRRHSRQRMAVVGAALAVAAALLVGIWARSTTPAGPTPADPTRPDTAHNQPMSVPVVDRPATPPANERVVRLGEEFSRAERAFIGTSRPITETAVAAPRVLAKLTDVLTRPAPDEPALEPIQMPLSELPEVARSGFEPITATTQKAFSRLMHDLGSVSAKMN
jgi:hypothetical protein